MKPLNTYGKRFQGTGRNNSKAFIGLVILLAMIPFLSGCGTFTGIPAHGGGKRFAVEQELVASATREAIKKIDLTELHGKKINIFVNAIGDTGAGNLVGGRFTVASQLRGDYLRSSAFTDGSRSGRNSRELDLGVQSEGMGSYQNSQELSSDDLQYLSGLLRTYFFLSGARIVPPSEAKVDVYVTVDVFGTVRSRVEWFLANNEILRAKTALEVMAVDHLSGELVMPPRSTAVEAEYNEQYVLWAGPVIKAKTLSPSRPLLSDFTDLEKSSDSDGLARQEEKIMYPFRHEIEPFMEDHRK